MGGEFRWRTALVLLAGCVASSGAGRNWLAISAAAVGTMAVAGVAMITSRRHLRARP